MAGCLWPTRIDVMTFTEKYFVEELSRFRQHLGDKNWWTLPEDTREACVSGLGLIYLNINNEDGTPITTEQIEKWARWFTQATTDYNARWAMINIKF
jgi:hypothetical protein